MQPKKILCVDDSTTVLLIEKLILGKWKYEVLTARDGEEALEVAARERPDLILLDVVMPRLNGFETCRRIRAHDAISETPVIMVTTRSELDNVEQAYVTGCTEFVTKPIDSFELLSKIRGCIGD